MFAFVQDGSLAFTKLLHHILVRFWFLIFVTLWSSEFITAMGKVALNLCYSQWYYTPEKEEGNEVSVCFIIGTSTMKHAGTAAFGSLLIKPISFIRAPVLALQTFIKKSKMDNSCIDAIICCCQCNLFVLERFLKFASKLAYNHTSIFGSTFCKSSHESYYLKLRNDAFFAQTSSLPFLSVFYCKLFIVSSVSVGSFALLDLFYGEELTSIVSVTAIIVMLSWFIGEIFTDVLGEAVSAILYCYVADEEIMGDEGSTFVTAELDIFLMKIVQSTHLASGGPAYTEEGYEVSEVPKNVEML